MWRWPPPSVARVAGIRTSAKTATTAAMTAAPMKPRENASAAPAAVVSVPAVLATADRTATPRAAPISCPVIRNPEATPACEAGMPAIEVTETGTKTMPTPSPRADSPGRMSVAKCAPLVAVDSTSDAATAMTQAGGGDDAGREVAQQVPRHDRAGGDGERERQERDAGLQGGEAEHGLQEDRGQEDGADQDTGDAEHDRGARDQGVELPDVRREQRLGRPPLELEEGREQATADAARRDLRCGPTTSRAWRCRRGA